MTFSMRHLGKKIAVCKKNYLFPREKKTCLLLLSARKRLNLRFPTLLSFSISLTGPIPLRIRFLWLLPKRKISILYLFTLLSLSLSPFVRVPLSLCLSLSLSLLLHTCSRISRKRKKEEINDVAVTFNDLLRIILLPCLFLNLLLIAHFVYASLEISDLFLSSVL